ncbi:hypothetical protein [Pectobacterium sp. B1J-3]|uniref:hypothetical protein n=1 Tax=Pectobacterium sp. B1J-3 TaxID=3385371 RepID=UPI003905EE09
MKSDFNSQLIYLSDELSSSYDKPTFSDEDNYIENKRIKSKIIDFILDAHSCGEILFVENALKLLLNNTGCQEDFEILEEILRPVIEKDIIDKELLNKYLKESPLSRWL